MGLLARMIQVSLVGFAVGGAFVNIGNWDMVYYLAAAALGTSRSLRERLAASRSSRSSNSAPSRIAAKPNRTAFN